MENNVFKIIGIEVEKETGEIKYQCTFGGNIAKYFNGSPTFYARYENVDLSAVPQQILIIPFLAQLLPIAWFANFTIHIQCLDQAFYNAMFYSKAAHLRQDFSSLTTNNLVVEKLIDTDGPTDGGTLLLYSGGVDSIFSFIRHRHESPDIVSVFGADMTPDNDELWSRHKTVTAQSALVAEAKKFYIKTNLRDFYSYKVPMLAPDRAWWGRIQHGIGLTGLLAPLNWLHGHTTVLISSSYSDDINVHWGSTAEKDNLLKWGKTSVIHDAIQTKRIDKIKAISELASGTKEVIILRVCYSSKNTEINCSRCEKCYRTILGLMINGADPNKYGFNVSANIYRELKTFIREGFSGPEEAYFWTELSTAIYEARRFFYFDNQIREAEDMSEIGMAIGEEVSKGFKKPSRFTLFRQKIQLMFPNLTKTLIKIRNKL